MNDVVTFTLGAAALLATPGPTNTLLATSGATRGIKASLPLLMAEAAGYVLAILILRAAIGPLLAAHPALSQSLSALVCLYLLYLSWRLWQSSSLPLNCTATITPGAVFLTTLLNPKAIVFAFTLLPADIVRAELAPWLAGLVALIALSGSGWITVGAAVVRQAGRGPRLGYRTGAIALFALAMALATRAAGMA